jgi:transposase
VDDWAWKRGHRYGTLLCDLERGIPIDVLPDRSVETVTAWFQSHPGIEHISRDRASEYALAANKGAPQAVRVADRWHVLKNLREALEALLAHHLTIHQKRKTQEMTRHPGSGITEKRPTRSSQQAHIQRLHRESVWPNMSRFLLCSSRESVNQLRQLDPEIDQAYLFVQQFVQMMRTRTGEKLEAWLGVLGSSSLVELHPFVNSLVSGSSCCPSRVEQRRKQWTNRGPYYPSQVGQM